MLVFVRGGRVLWTTYKWCVHILVFTESIASKHLAWWSSMARLLS